MGLAPGTRLGAYEILSLLGAGGMGEVYRAVDTRLGRDVAIKVLPPDEASDRERVDRLTREARAASALNHQNIAHIYEIGDADGRRFIAMEYVEGATLETAGRAWPLDRVLTVGAQLADGLDAAHRKGIVHRDIKPSNLMLTPLGQLKILDFGVAKVDPGQADARNLATMAATSPGAIVGTVGAFSPEQALGRDVDARSDLFSTGVVLYALATGRLPFTGATPIEITDRLLHAPPEAPSRVNAAIPGDLDRIIIKCLEKDRERRYQTAADLKVDLDALRLQGNETRNAGALVKRRSRMAIAGGLIAAAVLAAIGYALWTRSARSETIDSVAVLPFANEGADPGAEYLSDGIPDALIDALSQIPALRVIALSSTLRYKAHPADAKQVGADLGVRSVITGRVRQQGRDIMIAVEVVDARDDRRVWGQRYTRTEADIVGIQDELAREVADRLRGRLSNTETERIARRRTEDGEANRLYLQGRYFWNRYSEDGFNKAIGYFRQAIARDPSYALAYAGLADAEMQLGTDFLSPGATYPQGKAYAERALQLDPTLGEAHASLGIYAMWYDYDWPAADREYTRAIQLGPNYPVAHHFYAHYLDALGQTDASIAEILRALDHDPLSPFLMEEVAWTYYHARRYEEAIAWIGRALNLDPRFDLGQYTLAQIYVAKGAYAEAATALEHTPDLAGWFGVESERAALLALTGRAGDARRALDRLLTSSTSSYVDPYAIAIVYTALGDRDHAFEWLNRSIDGHSAYATFLNRDAKLDPLRADGRFAALTVRVGLGSSATGSAAR